MTGSSRQTRRLRALAVLGAVLAVGLGLPGGATPRAAAAEPGNPIPLLAYYYIWFNATSWNRAKTDYPLLGRYSSDERRTMEQHVQWAKSAGINGFIVSWKHTPTLDERLERLIAVADENDFKLAVIYQGLDFERRPLPTARIARDLDFFARNYARDPVFRIFGKPLVIWSGTWKFSRPTVERVTRKVRDRLLVLASEKNVKGYERLAGAVDGDAYYWSSVDPLTYAGYPNKLVEMGAAVDARDGLWIAPASVGFDARLIGGTRVVDRRDGQTLRLQMNGVLRSSPDAIGLISWNEFTENSHVEPSKNLGSRYLDVVAEIRDSPALSIPDFDSDQAATHGSGHGAPVLGGMIGLVVALIAAALIRRRRPGAD